MTTSKFQTYTGALYDYRQPAIDQVRAADLAHSLAGQGRFLAHTRTVIPVAQHLVMAAAVAWHTTKDRTVAACAAIHDAGETWTGDIPAPLKAELRRRGSLALDEIEAEALDVVCDWAALPRRQHRVRMVGGRVTVPPESLRIWGLVDHIDLRSLFHERDLFLGPPTDPATWQGDGQVQPLTPGDVGDVAGGPIWSPLVTPWSAQIAETAYRYTLAVLLPDANRPPDWSSSWPPPWLSGALRSCLPRETARA